MALDVQRWLQYARARIESAVSQGNASLDRREAEREVELADRPWLRADGEAPTLDDARARIEWETRRQAEAADTGTGPGPTVAPEEPAAAADAADARLQLDARERASAERLAAIRRELGVEPPADPPEDPPPDPPSP
ncbi:MAG: hypothetical protein JWM47_1729 [Acidimicrobiales bacterium]|nr:hypothetical protein [Acidimicrobiales bacterium]